LMNGWFTQSCYRRKPPGIRFYPWLHLFHSARLERLEDNGDNREMSRAVQRRATSKFRSSLRDQRYSDIVEFLVGFVDELNVLASEGAAVLVEGQRDSRALSDLGYEGKILTKASLSWERLESSLRGVRTIIILTDMDREGGRLAAKYVTFLHTMRIGISLSQRRRLRRASRGVFLHIENLSRFYPEVPELRKMTEKMRV
jgi:5S rRNA maturation endonuclease (ribonuclease M5)